MYDEMKFTQVDYQNKSVTLRTWRNKYKAKARKYRGNYPKWQERMTEVERNRMYLRVQSRYLGLARAFLKDKHYSYVENKTREGNEPDVEILLDELNAWGYTPEPHYVERWLLS